MSVEVTSVIRSFYKTKVSRSKIQSIIFAMNVYLFYLLTGTTLYFHQQEQY